MKHNSRRKPRTWRAPATIVEENAPFEIDAEIRSAKLQSRWSLDDAISFGRRALQVALEDAIENEGTRPNDQFKMWDRTADMAKKAHDTLRELLEYIGPSGLPTAGPALLTITVSFSVGSPASMLR
jgi:hypothetical protein